MENLTYTTHLHYTDKSISKGTFASSAGAPAFLLRHLQRTISQLLLQDPQCHTLMLALMNAAVAAASPESACTKTSSCGEEDRA